MENRCYGCMAAKGPEIQCRRCGWKDTDQNAVHQLAVGTVLQDRYLVGRVLGQGGFGVTYLGWDRELETAVAIKEYFPMTQVNRSQGTGMLATDELVFQEGKERFLKEADSLARLRSLPNIVQVYSFFSENNTVYIVMEYIDGITLQEHIRRRGGPLTPEETFALMQPIIQTMAQVHQSGMIHRDISPDNIMVKPDGSVKILDFGTARAVAGGQLTHSTQAVLKRGFAPMEQYSAGRDIDQRADEYALCTTMYYCMTAKMPPEAFDRYMDRKDIPWARIPGLSPGQVRVLKKATELKADNRYPDLASFADALFSCKPEDAVQQEPEPIPAEPEKPRPRVEPEISPPRPIVHTPVPPTQPAEPAPRRKSKSGRGLAVAAALLAVLAAGGWWMLSRGSEEPVILAEESTAAQTEPIETLGPEIVGYAALVNSPAKVRPAPDAQEAAIDTLAPGDRVEITRQEDIDGTRWGRIIAPVEGWVEMVNVELAMQVQTLDAKSLNTAGIRSDGTVVATGAYSDDWDVSGWTDMTAVAVGDYHLVGLKSDGTVVATGQNKPMDNYYADGTKAALGGGQCNVSAWQDMVAVAAGQYHTVGLKSDGTVVAIGENSSGQCNVSDWKDIVAIAAGDDFTVGLRFDGTVVAVGANDSGQCKVTGWGKIIAISCSRDSTMGLRADGTVIVAGNFWEDVSAVQDIVAIANGDNFSMGLKADGAIVATSYDKYLTGWEDIVAISVGNMHGVGLKSDGTVVAMGRNDSEQCDVSDWVLRVPD